MGLWLEFRSGCASIRRAVERVEPLVKECKVHRVDAIRALLSEALKRQDVVAAARRRLLEDEL